MKIRIILASLLVVLTLIVSLFASPDSVSAAVPQCYVWANYPASTNTTMRYTGGVECDYVYLEGYRLWTGLQRSSSGTWYTVASTSGNFYNAIYTRIAYDSCTESGTLYSYRTKVILTDLHTNGTVTVYASFTNRYLYC